MACGGDCGCEAGYCRVDELIKLASTMSSSCKNRGSCKIEKSGDEGCCKSESGDSGCCKSSDSNSVSMTADADVTYADSIASQLTFESPKSSDMDHPAGDVDEDPED